MDLPNLHKPVFNKPWGILHIKYKQVGTVDPMFYSGRIGTAIHYRMGNKYYIRAMPEKFKQTRATKERAAEFGLSSKIGTSIRKILSPIVPYAPDAKTRGRLVGVVAEWLRKHKRKPGVPFDIVNLSRFQFDVKQSSVINRWKVNIEIINPSPGLMKIKIPAFVPTQLIQTPAHTTNVVCQIGIGSVSLKDGHLQKKSKIILNFDYNDILVEEQIIVVDLPTPQESMIVTGASLNYGKLIDEELQNNTKKAFMPAGIINVLIV
jgi:hypothetical protein